MVHDPILGASLLQMFFPDFLGTHATFEFQEVWGLLSCVYACEGVFCFHTEREQHASHMYLTQLE